MKIVFALFFLLGNSFQAIAYPTFRIQQQADLSSIITIIPESYDTRLFDYLAGSNLGQMKCGVEEAFGRKICQLRTNTEQAYTANFTLRYEELPLWQYSSINSGLVASWGEHYFLVMTATSQRDYLLEKSLLSCRPPIVHYGGIIPEACGIAVDQQGMVVTKGNDHCITCGT